MMSSVLIVEDDPAQLTGLSTFLRHAGYQVHAASDAREAMMAGELTRLDAAICDWNLGEGPDGAAVMTKLKAAVPTLVSIFITGNDVARLKAETGEVEGARYFGKPVAPAELLEALRSLGCDP